MTFTRLTTVDLVNATDFRLLSRTAVDALLSLPEHASFFRGTSSWIGYRRAVVEVDIDHREGGASRWTLRTAARKSRTPEASRNVSPARSSLTRRSAARNAGRSTGP